MTIEQFNNNYVYFSEPIKNNIICDGIFIRIFYSNELVSLNSIYLLITLNDILCEKYYNKYKCFFNVNDVYHKNIIEKIKIIEDNLLKKIDIKNKVAQYKIQEHFKYGFIRLYNDMEDKTYCSFILKISGIWENSLYYGLTYKFIKINGQPYNTIL
jgi:hypothetical protein